MPLLPTPRDALLQQLTQSGVFDLAIVGGGATGLGVALDAAVRGLRVVLLESGDFAQGTSSRSTKLVHGGVRYLAQGHWGLVREALHERSTLLRNAPHLAQPLPFVMPTYRWWEAPFYGLGLALYDLLAGRAGLGRTRLLGPRGTLLQLPGARPQGLWGGVRYWDGQFDDARLALAIGRTAAQHGALLLNHCQATALCHTEGRVDGLELLDTIGGRAHRLSARCVVNATGVWADTLRAQEAQAQAPLGAGTIPPLVEPSQGVHLVVDRHFLPGDAALVVPQTADGRVLFAVPWLGKVVLGTTDTPRPDTPAEPRPFKAEVDFILNESARYLAHAPQRSDVRSVWVGLRPLVKPMGGGQQNTGRISREHTVLVGPGGLVTVTGGKWTTYRAMAEDVLEVCTSHGLLPPSPQGRTEHLPLVGADTHAPPSVTLSQAPGLHSYGTEAPTVNALPGAEVELAPGLTEAMVRFAARFEYAITVEDMLARRSRCLFLDAQRAAELAPRVGAVLAEETGVDPQVECFQALARQYRTLPT
jgi:glycerol-3-phosphate dehydrogenase